MQVTPLAAALLAATLATTAAIAQPATVPGVSTPVLPASAPALDPAARLQLSAPVQPPFRAAQPSAVPATVPGAFTPVLPALTSVYLHLDPARTDWQALSALGAQVGLCTAGFATVTLPTAQLSALASVPGVRYIQGARSAHLQLDQLRADVGADLAHQYHPVTPQPSLPYTGHGVIIGQVDAGIDYTHRAFRTADGTLRISRVWEQGTNAATAPIPGLHAPEGFGYGAEFDTPELILRAGADSEYSSHGTHVMGIAAGSDPYLDGLYQGLAPDAELVMVTISDVGADNVRISDAIKYIFDYADQQHKPCVINLSLGSHSGPHDGTSPFDQIADALQGPGRLIVGASGNYGGDLFHAHHEVQQPDTLQLYLCHAFYSSYAYGDVELWADSLLQFSFDMLDRNTYSGTTDVVASFTTAELADGQVHTYTLGRNITGSIQVTTEVNPLNDKLHLLLRSYITGQRNNHQVAMRIVSTQGTGQYDVWADDTKITLATRDKNGVIQLPEGYFNPDGQSTVTEIGGTARRILTVGAYTTRDHFQMEGSDQVYEVNYPVQQQPVQWAVPMHRDELCVFSGFGPTADDRQKPELCAPGSFIISSMSGYDLSSLYLASHYTDADGHPVRYGYLQGTSFSCPAVTGAVALWLQACPTLTPEQLKQVVAATSRTDALTQADPRRWGAGRLDVLAGLQRCEQLNHDDAIHTLPADSPDRPSRTTTYDLFGRPTSPGLTPGLTIRHGRITLQR